MIDEHAIGLLTVAEAADVAGVAQGTIRSWIHRYGLPTTRSPEGLVLVAERDLLDCELGRRRAGRGRKRTAA